MKVSLRILAFVQCLMTGTMLFSQTVTFGPTSPAASANTVNTCAGSSDFQVQFSNSSTTLSNVRIDIQLNEGIKYIPGSFSYTSSASAMVVQGNISNLNRPEFKIESLNAGEEITLTIGRVGNCDARNLKINGSTFSDSTFIYEAGVEVNYSNGVSAGVATYDIIYASLSIINVTNNPNPINIAGTATRSMEITNGSFGHIDSFTFVEVFPPDALTFSNFIINPAGSNYTIPIANIDTSGDSLIISFSPTEIMAINGSSGNGNTSFELDEQFVLQYDLAATSCGVGNNLNSSLSVFWGCENTTCQTGTNAASMAIVNATPVLTVSNVTKPALDICDTTTYSMTITNTSSETTPTGGSFAKDVVVFIGLRQNEDAVATLANMTMRSPLKHNTKLFSNYKINGLAVVLPTIMDSGNLPVSYIAPNHFQSDPDGPGGLEDIDGDGFFDDLAKDSSIFVSFDVSTNPETLNCGLGRADYIRWEHISSDINWYNQCGNLMTPKRREFVYLNMIRDYNNSTLFDHPTDLEDNDHFTASIKPHFYNLLTCNGNNGYTGTGVNWIVRTILPPGIIVDPAYDDTKFTVSGDTIYTEGSYSFDYTDFPLIADCNSWNNVNPVALTFQTVYECNSGGSNCFSQDVHCANIPIYMHCGTSCPGVEALSFSTLRTSGSWTSSNQDTLINIEDSGIERNIVYPGDTVEFTATSVYSDTMSDNLYLKITYTLADTFNIFLFDQGSINITDIDGEFNSGQINYNFPLDSAPTINDLGAGNYEMIFDLSAYAQEVHANYMFGKSALGVPNYDSDSISINATFTIGSAMSEALLHDVTNLRSYFYFLDNGLEVNCSSYGSLLSYQKVNLRMSAWDNFIDGCNSLTQNFYLSHISNSEDDHPLEYRPIIHWDSAVIELPVGFHVDSLSFLDKITMSTSDYTVQNNIVKVYRPSYYEDHDKWKTFFPRITAFLTPTCALAEGQTDYKMTTYYKEQAYLTDSAQHIRNQIELGSGFVNYTRPTFSLIPNEPVKEILEENVSWILNLCNGTSSSDVDYNWIVLNATTGGITIDSVLDTRNGTAIPLPITTRLDGSHYVELGELNIGTCVPFEIFGRLNSCDTETLSIDHGWGCSDYSDPEMAITCSASTTVSVKNKDPQISTNVTPLFSTPTDPANPSSGNWSSNAIDMCVPFPAEIKIVNAQPGNLYNTLLNLKIPSSGLGLSYVAGSMTIEVEGIDAINTPRAIGAAAESALVAASNGQQANWSVGLADLDPTNFGANEPLQGTDQVAQNEIVLRWLTTTTCDLSSGDQFTASVQGDNYCGTPAEGSGENINGFPIDINGVVPTYVTAISTSITPDDILNGCNDLKTLNIDLFISGGVTKVTDTLVVTLPEGAGYADGFVCNTAGNCPSFVSATMIGNQEEVRFAYTAGINGNINLDIDLSTSDRGNCTQNEIVTIKSENTLSGISCGAGTCPSTKAITGSSNFNIHFNKPDLSIGFTNVNYLGPTATPTMVYDLTLSNSGLATENDVIVDFYCLNEAGDDISGPSVARDTLNGILTNGSSANLSGTFDCNCNANQGMVVIITPEYDNCYCESIASLSVKNPGLAEIPHDKINNIPLPIEIASFTTEDKDCDILIQWSTISETNADYFIVERGFDGVHFLPITTVNASGNSIQELNYEYIDQGRNSSDQLYYRLKQVDFDGTMYQVETREHHRTTCEKLENELIVQPNIINASYPETEVVFFNNNGYESAGIQLYDLTGQLIYERPSIPLHIDRNSIPMELENLQSGSYQVILYLERGKIYTSRFVIME